MNYKPLTPEYDTALANLIRTNLKAHGLDIPGTVYFDEGLDHLSDFYADPRRAYFILTEDEKLIGGIGLAEFPGLPDCCELQKLYLDDGVRGAGLGYKLIRYVEETAKSMDYKRMYLETHTNLQAAIHIYEKAGYVEIGRMPSVVHSTMNKFYLKEL